MIVEITSAISVIILTYIILTYCKHLVNLRHFPPGPFPYPVIGNLNLFRNKKQHDLFTELSKVYGDVFSISLGMERAVVINTIEPTLEALVKNSNIFSGRPSNHFYLEILSRGFKDIVLSDYGEHWKFVRKLGFSSLKMINDNFGGTEKNINIESEDMFNRLIEANCLPVNVRKEIGVSVFNIMTSLLFGKRYEKNDPEFLMLMETTSTIGKCIANNDPIAFIRWLRFIYPTKNYKTLISAYGKREIIIRKMYLQQKNTFKKDKIRHFTDTLLSLNLEDSDYDEKELDTYMEIIIEDMIVAGVATTLTSIQYMVLYLLHHPEYQDLIFKEMIDVVGETKNLDLSHIRKLPTLQSFIHESLRVSSFTPLLVPHKANANGSVNSLPIPKDTMIFFNLWNIHHDLNHWKDADKFEPKRWINSNGEFDKKLHKSFIPFSIGKRSCIGESLAMKEIFLYLSRLIKEFEIKTSKNEAVPSLETEDGLMLEPRHFLCRFIPRSPKTENEA